MSDFFSRFKFHFYFIFVSRFVFISVLSFLHYFHYFYFRFLSWFCVYFFPSLSISFSLILFWCFLEICLWNFTIQFLFVFFLFFLLWTFFLCLCPLFLKLTLNFILLLKQEENKKKTIHNLWNCCCYFFYRKYFENWKKNFTETKQKNNQNIWNIEISLFFSVLFLFWNLLLKLLFTFVDVRRCARYWKKILNFFIVEIYFYIFFLLRNVKTKYLQFFFVYFSVQL